MVFKVNKDDKIYKVYRNKLGLEVVKNEGIYVPPTLQLTKTVNEVYQQTKAQEISSSVANRTDTYTVPDGKRWTIIAFSLGRANAATATMDLIIAGVTYTIQRSNGAVSQMNLTDVVSTIVLDAGDSIQCVAGAAGAGTITTDLIYIEEDHNRIY